MKFHWIDLTALPPLSEGFRLVLFGAGNGSRELLIHLQEACPGIGVVAVADNDLTLQGRELSGVPIVSPDDLSTLTFDKIIVTTVSGRESVSAQLQAQGLAQDEDFVCIGKFPRLGCEENLTRLVSLNQAYDVVHGRVVHIGPGGFFGLECGLEALYGNGISSLVSIDAYGFGAAYPDCTSEMASYARLRDVTLKLARTVGIDTDLAAARWDALFQRHGDTVQLNQQRIAWRIPHRFSSLPFADGETDLVCSFAVLEHVRSPKQAVDELWRVLAPGGRAVQHIITSDHRSYGSVHGYSPISYRMHSEAEWQQITEKKFHQNRVAPFQWKELFESRGFTLQEYTVLNTYTPSPVELASLHSDFRDWPEERQQEVNCIIVAAKA